MTINDMHPTDLIEHRRKQAIANRNKIISDIKNDTDDLTFANRPDEKSNSSAAIDVSNYRDDLAISKLMSGDDISDLMKMMEDL